jgi:hypothetical protein
MKMKKVTGAGILGLLGTSYVLRQLNKDRPEMLTRRK